MKSIWERITVRRQVPTGISAGFIVLGILVIAAGEIRELGWTRIIGAGTISFASIVLGMITGWSDPIRPRIVSILSNVRTMIVAVLVTVMIGPLIAGMIFGFGGLITGGRDADWILSLTGILITFLLLVMTTITAWRAVRLALQGLKRESVENRSNTDGRGEP